MFERKTEGSVVCPSCKRLVGVNDEECYHCGRRNPGMWGYAHVFNALGQDLGFEAFVVYGSVLMYVVALAWDPGGIGTGGLRILSPSLRANVVFGASGGEPIFEFGRWWTPLSAAFLHGGLIHIFFNMYWAKLLIPAVTDAFGASRAVILYTVSSVVGFLLSSFMFLVFPGVPLIGGAPFTLGASAAVFGLLGALIAIGGSVGAQAKFMAVFLFVFGFLFPGIDNWAHLGGLGGGYFMANALDPSKPDSEGHIFAALGCIAAFIFSILLSVFHAYLPL